MWNYLSNRWSCMDRSLFKLRLAGCSLFHECQKYVFLGLWLSGWFGRATWLFCVQALVSVHLNSGLRNTSTLLNFSTIGRWLHRNQIAACFVGGCLESRKANGCFLWIMLSSGQSSTTLIHLVDPASSHMLVSKIKPCMSGFKLIFGEAANGSLYQL